MIRAARALSGAFFVAGLVGGLAACSGERAGPDAATPAVKQREAVRVRTSPIEQREMVRTISTTTTVESEREIRLCPRGSGTVVRLACEEGDRVAAGAVLAELDRRASQAAITEARIALREAEDAARKAQLALPEAENRVATAKLKWEQAAREFERNEKAALISAQALDNLRVARDMAQSEHDGAKLAVQRAEVEIAALGTQKAKAEVALQKAELEDSHLIVTAPFDGVIAQRLLKVGDSSSPSTPAFVLTDPTALRAIVHRPQRELSMFFAAQRLGDGNGLEIRAAAEALPDKTFPGEIHLVSPSIDPTSGSFRVTVRLPSAPANEAGLLPGMLVRLEIVTDRHPNALAVPKRALRREGGSDFVFVVDGGKSRRVEVKEGFSDDASTEVEPLHGAQLSAGMRVIVIGNREIEDGADVLEEAASAPPAPEPAASETPAQDTTASTTKG
jgi:RND family efflux transporter MFP subunit